MGDSLRREVLQVFKRLHRTRLNTFKDDKYALEVVRNRINDEYRKYKSVTNPDAITELNKFAQEVEHEVRTTVIQMVQKETGNYSLRITPDTVLLDNAQVKTLMEDYGNKVSECTASTTSKTKK